jgi:hypothetical protein
LSDSGEVVVSPMRGFSDIVAKIRHASARASIQAGATGFPGAPVDPGRCYPAGRYFNGFVLPLPRKNLKASNLPGAALPPVGDGPLARRARAMETIFRSPTRAAWATKLERPFRLEAPFQGQAFSLLLAVYDTTVTSEERTALSEQIVRQGCRYAVCTGHECSSWDDSIDLAHMESAPDLSPPDSEFVMTTWHDNESIREVAEFFVHTAKFEGFEPERFLVVCVGGDEATYFRARHAVCAQFGS